MTANVYGMTDKVSLTGDTMTGPLSLPALTLTTSPTAGDVLTSDAMGNASWQANQAVNVTVYGAKGDGTTDDTVAIQNAIEALHTAGGGTIYFPSGTYKLSSALTVHTNTLLRGAGSAVSILKQTNTTANGLNCQDSVAVTVTDLQITGPGSGSGIGLSFTLSTRTNCYQIDLTDILVQSFGSHGIAMTTPIISRLTRVVTVTNGGDGFHLTGGGTSLTLASCYSNGDQGTGYNLNQLNYSTLNGCAADSFGGTGYLLTTCNNVSLTSCGAEAGTGNCFTMSGGRANSLISCYTRSNNAIGAYFTGSTLSAFTTGFWENSPTTSATASIQVDSGCRVLLGENETTTATNLDANGTTQINGNSIYCSGNNGTSSFQVNRGATTNFATYQLLTGGVEQWVVGGMLNDSTNDMHVQDAINGKNALIFEQHPGASNVQIGNTKSFGGGIGVVGLTNAATVPSTNPTGGLVAYSAGGQQTNRNPQGLVQTVSGVVQSQTATVTNAVATTVTPMTSFTVPANDVAVGAVYRIEGYGVFTSTSSTLAFSLYWGGTGGTLLASIPAITLGAFTNAPFSYEATVTCRSATSVVAKLRVTLASSTTTDASNTFLNVPPTPTTITSTGSNALVVATAWSAASQSISLLGGTVSRVA